MTDAEHSVHPDSHSIEGFPCDMPHKSYELHGHREGGRPFAIVLWDDRNSLEAKEAREAEWSEVRLLAMAWENTPIGHHLAEYAKILKERL